MERPPYPSADAFRRAYTFRSAAPGSAGALLIIAYFAAVLDPERAVWVQFAWSLLAQIVLMTVYGQWMQRRIDRDIVAAIETVAAGTAAHDDFVRAYVASRLLPQRAMRLQVSNYVFAAAACPLWLWIAVPDVTAFTLIAIAIGALTGGAACVPFALWAMQRFIAPTRDYFAGRLSPEERAHHAPPASLKARLALPVVATSTATVAFLTLLGCAVALDLLEHNDVRVKQAFLDGARLAAAADPAALGRLGEVARRRGVAQQVGVVDPRAPAEAPPEGLTLSRSELRWLLREDAQDGSSAGFDSRAVFAWVPLADGRLLVAATPIAELVGGLGPTFAVVAIVLVGVVAVSLTTALLVAADTRRVAARLRSEAERVGAGDFTSSAVIESEDELGAVAHAFAKMTVALGATLKRVVATAADMEAAAGELAKIGAAVRSVTAAQVEGIERANASVSVVNRQASAITTSAQELIGSVEEAGSSVLELGAASEQLNQTAIALNVQVEAVGTSIDHMVRSVGEAGEASEALSLAVVDSNSSVAEMVRTMESVDAHALETARLSTRVVELADGGRARVQETIRGMEGIRDATDSANMTIGSLAGRMQEIGAIVDVIDEVADETNLLALNAAIIAAQAGEQGRAFSVVADEIKDLADRVLANTKEIGGLIRSVQTESSAAAEAIRQGADRVQSGVDLSAQAGVALEEITAAARHAGERIQEIVEAMREQTRAAAHVEQLSLGVSERVEQIRAAGREQGRGNEVVMRGALVMRDVAAQTQRTTEEQARGALRIRDSIEAVREAVDRIHAALRQQNDSCAAAAGSLEEVFQRTRSNDEATDALGSAANGLKAQAEALRNDVRKFRVA